MIKGVKLFLPKPIRDHEKRKEIKGRWPLMVTFLSRPGRAVLFVRHGPDG